MRARNATVYAAVALVLGLLLLAALWTSSANAARLDAAQRVAANIYPPPCAVVIETGPVTAGHSAEAHPDRCAIRYTPGWEDWSDHVLCSVTVHEYGHLAGHGHEPGGWMDADQLYPGAACRWPPSEAEITARIAAEAAQARREDARYMLGQARHRLRRCRTRTCRKALRTIVARRAAIYRAAS